MDLLFPGFVLLQLQLYEEGDKQSKSDAEGDDEPEVDVVLGFKAEQEVGEGSDAQADEDARPAQRYVFVRLLFLFLDEGLGGLEVGVVLDEQFAQFGLALLLSDTHDDHADDGHDGNRKGKYDGGDWDKFWGHNCYCLND